MERRPLARPTIHEEGADGERETTDSRHQHVDQGTLEEDSRQRPYRWHGCLVVLDHREMLNAPVLGMPVEI